MKKIFVILFGLVLTTSSFAQKTEVNPVVTGISSEKHLSSSILLWMRTDQPRQDGMNRWKGPHAKIISANKGLWEYRQIHFEDKNQGLWQDISGVETQIPAERKIDGVADVTLKGFLSIFRGGKQNKLAHQDEVNIFKRTILYAAFPKNSKWYKVASSDEFIPTRSMVFIRKREGVKDRDFQKFVNEELTPALANMGILKELRNKVYNPWKQSQWNTPNVAHDNAPEVQFHASLILGFGNQDAMNAFFKSDELKSLSGRIAMFCSAVHAYEVAETLTFIKNGKEIVE